MSTGSLLTPSSGPISPATCASQSAVVSEQTTNGRMTTVQTLRATTLLFPRCRVLSCSLPFINRQRSGSETARLHFRSQLGLVRDGRSQYRVASCRVTPVTIVSERCHYPTIILTKFRGLLSCLWVLIVIPNGVVLQVGSQTSLLSTMRQ